MYVVGSFFHFSVGGWTQLKGYDLTPESSKGGMFGIGKGQPLYVVHSTRSAFPTRGPAISLIEAALWESEVMEPDERRLCSERLNALVKDAETDDERTKIVESASGLDSLYEILSPMKKVLPMPIMSMLASNLAPSWTNSGPQQSALREGLGLETPRDLFWKPLGEQTSDISAEDKIWLLVDVIPFFADASNEDRLVKLPNMIAQARDIITEKVQDLEAKDVQLLAMDLAITDFLNVKDEEARNGFIPWLKDVPPYKLREFLESRKNYSKAPVGSDAG